LREAAEQLFGLQALDDYNEERRKETPADGDETDERSFEEKQRGPALSTVRDDDEARSIADTPHLTGDPEFDAIELAETDPSRLPLRERMRGFG